MKKLMSAFIGVVVFAAVLEAVTRERIKKFILRY
jgi:hypothetical protein